MANEIIKGVVEKKYQKEIDTKKGKALRTAYTINGESFSTLDKELGNFNQGDMIQLSFVKSGNFFAP